MKDKSLETVTIPHTSQSVSRVMEHLGLDPSEARFDGGQHRTPERFVRAYEEFCATTFHKKKPPALAIFDAGPEADVLVTVRKIWFISLCEHHLVPFEGTVDFGYLPHRKVIGLSKIPRVVEYFSRQPQMQERLCSQIASFIQERVQCFGVGCRVTARHMCMDSRGVKAHGADTVTTTLLGSFRDPAVRTEWFDSLIP